MSNAAGHREQNHVKILLYYPRDFWILNPKISRIIEQDFYVDDLLTGTSSIQEMKEIKESITNILHSGGFDLCKWISNESSILDINQEVQPARDIGEEVKALGLTWESNQDNLRYKAIPTETQKSSKRSILSTISQIFDPLGLVGPCTIQAKIIMQKLWQFNCGWDESLPNDIHTSWLKYQDQITKINIIEIPRQVVCNDSVLIELHGFCDASELAYGACIYLKSTNSKGEHTIRLLCAKSKVAPLKKVTLPRLELCSALLLANLSNKVVNALTLKINKFYHWNDSMVALAWIYGEPAKWKTFVGNRVAEIQTLTERSSWNYVKSEENPIDIISRGINLWWQGPQWLREDIELWPTQSLEYPNDVPETKSLAVTTNYLVTQDYNIFSKFSSLKTLKHVIAYCIRYKRANISLFTNQDKSKPYKQALKEEIDTGPLTAEELEGSMNALLRLAQEQAFFSDLNTLESGKLIKPSSKLLSLNPLIGRSNLIRVGGRLSNAPISYAQKHPILLPSNHPLTDLIIRNEHYQQLHAGPQALLASIRTRYWILSGRSAVRRVLHRCVLCFRVKPTMPHQLMGDLPEHRDTSARVFLNSGVDYAGPFRVKISRNVTGKSYLCLFVCFATKAVHLELVMGATTEAFLNALKRFIARRGKVLNLYSDNGTNFVGANNELRDLNKLLKSKDHQSKVQNFLADNSMNWHFIPASSSHMGGLWEAAVKSAKTHLRKVMGSSLLTFEELTTVFAQIEACLNSRPLIPISSDPTDFTVLTPGHLIIGEPLTCIPEEDLREVPKNRLTRFQHLTQIKQHFWSKWSQDYLTQLQHRSKWTSVQGQKIKPGTMVLLQDKDLPPMKWHLGRVIEVHPGKDGLTRVVTVQTKSDVTKRALNKICILPIEDNN